jgi:hypothetical protein
MRAITAVAGYGSCDKRGAGQANTLFTVDPTAGPVRGRDRFIRLRAAEVDDAALAAKMSDADVAQAEQRALADGRRRAERQPTQEENR